MFLVNSQLLLFKTCFFLILISNLHICECQQQEPLQLKTDTIILDLQHKFGLNQEFKQRGSIHIKPRTDHRVAQANVVNQKLSDEDLKALKEASEQGEAYYLRANLRKKTTESTKPLRATQTLVKSCSLYTSNLADFITVNLSPLNDFINVNLFTANPECLGEVPQELTREFNTTVLIDSAVVGPVPDTATYIKRLEEERQNKLKEGKEDNRSFFAKYWIFIVPAVIILMIFSGPGDQGGR